ncbi:DUF29 domain-containing protein [Paraburkholderia sp. MM6662-R1]|uniref:DUF29 domain-containing protein n=1 Tax=Paraburkholderia sp. MM6662-R1 TaxID=2991066 RepID=UPI003D1E03B8
MSTLHDTDFHAWTAEQAELLRAGKLAEADIVNIIEELEDMGSSERSQLTNRLGVLLTHLLTWAYQPERRSRIWRATVDEQRVRIARLILKNPSLKSYQAEAVEDAYAGAIYAAERETGLDSDVFPRDCPWTFDEAMTLPVQTP